MVQTRLKVGNYEAWVVVEKEEVEHYSIEVDEEVNLATCWIASTAGKHFGVCVVKHHVEFDCSARVDLDGSKTKTKSLLKHNMDPKLIDNVRVGRSSFRPFLFRTLNVTEDESAVSAQMHEELGTIKVVVRHIINYKSSRRGHKRNYGHQLQGDVKIHESAKKLATHQVSFGEVQMNPTGHVQTNPTGHVNYESKEIVATFVFHYRSLEMLKALEIAPCDFPPAETDGSSEPGPVSGKRKVALIEEEEKPIVEISDPEDEDDNRRMSQLEAEMKKIRQARLDRQQGKRVKREPKPVFLPGEIIDLTT